MTIQLPQASEVWLTACGAKVAITGRTTIEGGGWCCLTLDPGPLDWASGHQYVVKPDGRYVRLDYEREHALDLVAFITRY
jgi:hypothetical protein